MTLRMSKTRAGRSRSVEKGQSPSYAGFFELSSSPQTPANPFESFQVPPTPSARLIVDGSSVCGISSLLFAVAIFLMYTDQQRSSVCGLSSDSRRYKQSSRLDVPSMSSSFDAPFTSLRFISEERLARPASQATIGQYVMQHHDITVPDIWAVGCTFIPTIHQRFFRSFNLFCTQNLT